MISYNSILDQPPGEEYGNFVGAEYSIIAKHDFLFLCECQCIFNTLYFNRFSIFNSVFSVLNIICCGVLMLYFSRIEIELKHSDEQI